MAQRGPWERAKGLPAPRVAASPRISGTRAWLRPARFSETFLLTFIHVFSSCGGGGSLSNLFYYYYFLSISLPLSLMLFSQFLIIIISVFHTLYDLCLYHVHIFRNFLCVRSYVFWMRTCVCVFVRVSVCLCRCEGKLKAI